MTTVSVPAVTVLMAVHNGGPLLDAAVASILGQSFDDFELVVVDDASTDDTRRRLDACTDPRVRVIASPVNRGLTASLNLGLRHARGALVARQDADDVSHPQRLAKQVAFLRAQPGVAMLGTQARIVDIAGRPVRGTLWRKCTAELSVRWQLLFDTPFFHSSVMFRTSVVRDELGGYDEQFHSSQDFELWSRAARRGYGLRNLAEALIDFRAHAGSLSARYEPERIAKVGTVLYENLVTELGAAAVPPGWPETWVRISNPRAYPGSGRHAREVSNAIRDIHGRFVARHPDGARDSEIRRSAAAMLLRVAHSAALDRRLGAFAAFAAATRFDPSLSAAAVPRLTARFIIGANASARSH